MNIPVGDQEKADFDVVGFLDNAQAPPGPLQTVKVLRIVCINSLQLYVYSTHSYWRDFLFPITIYL